MGDSLLWLTEQDVVSLVTLEDAIDALEAGLRALGTGGGFNVPKALAAWGAGSSLHSLGSALPQLGYAGYKNWVNTKHGATALFVMFDSDDGRLVAVIEAFALGQLRTAAMTGVGTKWLAPGGAADMALIGSGSQALAQVAAVNAVRPLQRLRVYSPDAERRRAFVGRVRDSFDFAVVEAASVASAVDGAALVTLVTRAREPFLDAGMLAPGSHLNAVGAILPDNAEFAQNVFERAGIVAVDDLANVQKASREFRERYLQSDRSWSEVRPIADIIAGDKPRPAAKGEISLFKAMGTGIADLSVAVMALERARARGLGCAIAHPVRAVPVWQNPVRV